MIKQDECLQLLNLQAPSTTQENEDAIQSLTSALSFTAETPIERILEVVKEELGDLIDRTRTAIRPLLNDGIHDPRTVHSILELLEEQPFFFPRIELEKILNRENGLPPAIPLRAVLSSYVKYHASFEKRLGWLLQPKNLDEIQSLDPRTNCDEIYHFITYEFRSEMKIYTFLYEMRAIIAAHTNSFFLSTGEFTQAGTKRLVDTVLLVSNILEWGIESVRGRKCLQKINSIHSEYHIPNDAFKFVLCGILFVPEDWNLRLGWRKFTRVETLGWFHALLQVGRAMNIGDLEDDYEKMKVWYQNYCQTHVSHSKLKRKLFDQVLGQFLATYPDKIRPLISSAILAGLDDFYRTATGYPEPPPAVMHNTRSVFFTLGQLGAQLPRIPWIRTLQSNVIYPHGYRVEELGVHRRSARLPNSTQRSFSLAEVSQHCTEDDLWVILDGEVYDLTEFIHAHPGGKKVLLQRAGQDASQAFAEAGHSPAAHQLLYNFRIGHVLRCPFAQ